MTEDILEWSEMLIPVALSGDFLTMFMSGHHASGEVPEADYAITAWEYEGPFVFAYLFMIPRLVP